MVSLRVTLLGGFEALLASGTPLGLPKKAQALLAYLAARPGERHSRQKLAALLWGERSDDQARGGLRHALVALRRALADAHPPPLRIEGQTLTLNPDGVEVDVVIFERRLAERRPEALEHASGLYRGDLLLGFHVNEPLFEEWLVAERERLREMALESLSRLLAHQTRTAATERAIQTALRLLALDPLQEAVHRTLMRLYARQGRRGAALKQYQACVGVLQRELGTAPEASTRQLYQELLRPPVVVPAAEARADARGLPAGTVGLAAADLPAAETPLFGREAELERLRRRLAEAMHGSGQIVAVLGEAGIGKTRLASTVAGEALSRGCRVLLGHCHESDSILPFGPWVDAFRRGGASADEEILGALHPTRRAELARLLPEAGRAGLPPPGDSALLLFESVADLVEHAAAGQPLMLVLEDLHWADEMSLRLLGFVGRRIRAWPVLLIVSAREEELAGAALARRTIEDLSRLPGAISVALSALSRPDTVRLVRAMTRAGRDPRTLAQLEEQVCAMSEGNPFVAMEAIRALDREGASDEAREEPGALALPERVRELVARHLDRLSARSQPVAAVAAVIGRQFEFGLLQAVSGAGNDETAEAVEEMVRHRVLHAVGSQLDFTHDRIRDVAYGRLLAPRRRVLHRAVAEALEGAGAGPGAPGEALSQGDPGERVEQLAHHAVQGGLWEKAVEYLRRAGQKAAARSALQEARSWFEEALGALAKLPESRATLEQGFDVHLELRPVLTLRGDIRAALERLREAEGLAERLDDDSRRGRVHALMTNVHSQLGEPDEAVVAGTRALEIARRLGDVSLRILTTTYLAQAHYYRGGYERVVELITDNLATLSGDRVHEHVGLPAPASIYDRWLLVQSLAELGRFAEAVTDEAEAIRLAEPTQHAYTIGESHFAAGVLRLLRGDWVEARRRLEYASAVFRSGNVVLPLLIALAGSAWACAQHGAADDARERVRETDQLLERHGATGMVLFRGRAYGLMGRTWLALGRLAPARDLAERAVELLPPRSGFAIEAQHLLGDLAAHPERFDVAAAEAHYRAALTLAEPRAMRPLVAHCHLGLGTLYGRAGEGARSRQHLTTAETMYREMGMPFWLEKAEAVLAAQEAAPLP